MKILLVLLPILSIAIVAIAIAIKWRKQTSSSPGTNVPISIILSRPEDSLRLPKGGLATAKMQAYDYEHITVPLITDYYQIDFDAEMVIRSAQSLINSPFYQREYKNKRFLTQEEIVSACGGPFLIEMARNRGLFVQKIASYDHPSKNYSEY